MPSPRTSSFALLTADDQVQARRVAKLENREAIEQSLDLHAQGVDFADALHLSLSREAKKFVTFDRKLRTRMSREKGWKLPEVVEP